MKQTTTNTAGAILILMWAASMTLLAYAQPAAAAATIGSIRLTRAVLANGQPLPAGTYQVRIADDEPASAIGETPGAERWVEFVTNGKVAGREVATVIAAADIGAIVKGGHPGANSSRVDVLKGGDYVRVWVNKSGNNYIINMPVSSK